MLHTAFLDRPLAHRALHDGARDCPENSRAAVRAAVAAGYGIEIDVQPSSDGVAMVFHDATLDRMTDHTGRVMDHSASELSDMALLGGAEKIPTLAEVLTDLDANTPLLIEVKDQSRQTGAHFGQLEQGIANAIKQAGKTGPLAIMSFNPMSMAAWRRITRDTELASIPVGLTTYGFDDADVAHLTPDQRSALQRMDTFEDLGACFISHDRRDLGSPHVAAIKARGVPVLCWTVRTPKEEATARKVADNITFEGYLP